MNVIQTHAETLLDALDFRVTIVAALLHGVLELENVKPEDIEKEFGKDIRVIVEGSTRITNIKIKNKTLQQADSVRKMLFAMIDDIRVPLLR